MGLLPSVGALLLVSSAIVVVPLESHLEKMLDMLWRHTQ